jgi:hypothetical protein
MFSTTAQRKRRLILRVDIDSILYGTLYAQEAALLLPFSSHLPPHAGPSDRTRCRDALTSHMPIVRTDKHRPKTSPYFRNTALIERCLKHRPNTQHNNNNNNDLYWTDGNNLSGMVPSKLGNLPKAIVLRLGKFPRICRTPAKNCDSNV